MSIDDMLAEVERLDAKSTKNWAQHDEYDRALVTVENPTMSLLALDSDGTALFDRAIDCETAAYYRTAAPLLAAAYEEQRAECEKLRTELAEAKERIEWLEAHEEDWRTQHLEDTKKIEALEAGARLPGRRSGMSEAGSIGDVPALEMRPMMPLEQIAIEALKCALSWEPNVRLIGNVMASEIAALAASRITSCPKCGAEPWVNIDCDLCLVCSSLEHGEMP